MNNKLQKIWNITSTVIVIFIVICAILLVGARLLGFRVFNVISGSMEPKYNVGDLIYVKKTDPSEIKEGDVITFVLNEDLVVATHRVVRVDTENKHFYTKGDANDTEDASPVHFNNFIGVPKFKVPLLGYVSDFVQNPPGTYVSITVAVILLIGVFVPDIIRKKKEILQNGEKSEENEE